MSMERIIGRGDPSPRNLDGTVPVTNSASKKVMLRAERNDEIEFTEVVRHLSTDHRVPNGASVLQRSATYYGPGLLLHTEFNNRDFNYQLTAPGPDTHLYLWGSETDEQEFRKSWFKLAEVKARFADQQPQYDICSDCGEPIKTLEHERSAAFGQCSMSV